MRSYERSHPWLKFDAELSRASPEFWMLLGEARSKCEHLKGVPLRPATAEKLHLVYLAKGIAATTAIEGNTLSESEVQARIEGKLQLPPSKEYLGREVDNVLKACHSIFARLKEDSDSHPLTVEMIRRYNEQVLVGLEVEREVEPGAIRKHNVGVARYRGAPAEDCEYLLQRMCDWLNGPAFHLPQYGVAAAILKALLGHLYLAWIHPFGDGNGRTARLLELHVLLAAGIPTPAAHLLSNHYNETRSDYYRQLDYASRSGDDVVPFMTYATRGFVDQLKKQIEFVREEQRDVTWRNYVHEQLSKPTNAVVRQRHLLLDLSRAHGDAWIAQKLIREISPRLALAYATKTSKTLSRDINALATTDLLEVRGPLMRARREVILAFLPDAVAPPTTATTAL